MHRIAVIADTHDRVSAGLPERLAAADEIWHLGDVCRPGTLKGFEALGKPLHVVMGNNDREGLWPGELKLTRGGLRCLLIHIPPRKAPKGVDLILHGHTHVPRDETLGGLRWLNPGCITRPNQGAPASFAWLLLEKDQPPSWKVVPLA